MKQAKLVGVPISYDLTTVSGSVTTDNCTLYKMTITYRKKKTHKLNLYDIDDMCGEMGI